MEQRACSKREENRQEQDKGIEEFQDKNNTRLIKTSAKKESEGRKTSVKNKHARLFIYIFLYFFIFFHNKDNTWTDIRKHVDGYTQIVDVKLFIFHISGINIDARPCICYNLSMRGVIMKNDLKLRQSNNLILASHQMDINQMRIFFYVCSQYNGDLKLSLSFNEMNNILNVNRGTEQKKSLISSISTMMRTAFVNLKIDEDDEYCEAPVFIMARKKKNEDIMNFEFNPHVAKELEELRGYTWMYLSQLTGMSSTYSVRLYEFFAMRLGTEHRSEMFDFDLNKLRLYLDCTKKYKDFRDFNKRVLLQAEKEINEKSNIHMSYKKVKTGRSVTSILFTFKWKNKAEAITVNYEENELSEAEQMNLDDFLKEFE